MLALTFTNRAANELRERLEEEINPQDASSISVNNGDGSSDTRSSATRGRLNEDDSPCIGAIDEPKPRPIYRQDMLNVVARARRAQVRKKKETLTYFEIRAIPSTLATVIA